MESVKRLASKKFAKGKYDAAAPMYEQVFCGIVKDPEAIDLHAHEIMHRLSTCYRHLGRYVEATELEESALKDLEAVNAGMGSEASVAMNKLAFTLAQTGRIKSAIKLLEKARNNSAVRLGRQHPRTITIIQNLAVAYRVDGKHHHDQLLNIGHDSVAGLEGQLGHSHIQTLQAMTSLCSDYVVQDQKEKAQDLPQQLSQRVETLPTTDRLSLIVTTEELASWHGLMDGHVEAHRLREWMSGFAEDLFDAKHALTFLERSRL